MFFVRFGFLNTKICEFSWGNLVGDYFGMGRQNESRIVPFHQILEELLLLYAAPKKGRIVF